MQTQQKIVFTKVETMEMVSLFLQHHARPEIGKNISLTGGDDDMNFLIITADESTTLTHENGKKM